MTPLVWQEPVMYLSGLHEEKHLDPSQASPSMLFHLADSDLSSSQIRHPGLLGQYLPESDLSLEGLT